MARDFRVNKKNKIRTIITVIGVLWGIFIYVVLSGAKYKNICGVVCLSTKYCEGCPVANLFGKAA